MSLTAAADATAIQEGEFCLIVLAGGEQYQEAADTVVTPAALIFAVVARSETFVRDDAAVLQYPGHSPPQAGTDLVTATYRAKC